MYSCLHYLFLTSVSLLIWLNATWPSAPARAQMPDRMGLRWQPDKSKSKVIHLRQEEPFAFRGHSPTHDVGSEHPCPRERARSLDRDGERESAARERERVVGNEGEVDGEAVTREIEKEWHRESALDSSRRG